MLLFLVFSQFGLSRVVDENTSLYTKEESTLPVKVKSRFRNFLRIFLVVSTRVFEIWQV